MRVDSHQHFWKYNEADYGWMGPGMEKLRRDHLPGELAVLLQETKIAGSVAVQARQNLEETRWLIELAEENEIIKGVVGWVELVSDRVKEALEKFSARRMLRGVRHVLHDEEDDRYMLRGDFLRGISKLAQYDLTYDILIFPRHIQYAVELVNRFPEQRFIVDHIAKPFIKKGEIRPWKRDMEALAKAENVFCKMSGMVTEGSWNGWRESDFVPYMESVLEMFGAERVAFGSDWPVCTVAASYQETVGIVENYISSFSADEQAKIMGLNAVRFYGLDL